MAGEGSGSAGTPLGRLIATGRTAEIFALGDDRVVKLLRPGFPDDLVHAEAGIGAAVAASGVGLAPRVFGVGRWSGRPGLVVQRVRGPVMLDVVVSQPARTDELARLLGRLHARLHATAAPRTVLADGRRRLRGAIEESMRTGVDRVTGAEALARVDRLPGEPVLCHGDFHPANVILTDDGPRVIDWLDATAGPPLADVARTLFLLVDAPLPANLGPSERERIADVRARFASTYLAEYGRAHDYDPAALDAWRLPLRIARLSEEVPGERDWLLRLITASA